MAPFDDHVDEFTFTDYQHIASRTAIYPRQHSVAYLTHGLNSEAGEVAGRVKKAIRDSGGDYQSHKHRIGAELGDVLWYVAELCTVLGLDLQDVALDNLEKLHNRQVRGTLGGDGDDR